jgi:hypothetical protein
MSITAFEAINDALEQCSDLGFEYSPGFATHWAMASETLTRLGHPELVHDWVARYRTRHKHFARPVPVSDIDESDETSWCSALGNFDRATDWQALFDRSLAEEPWQDVLVRWWPRLIPGVVAGLTHGLIRTTHAVRSITGSDEPPTALQLQELATALAYWASKYLEHPGQPALLGDERLPAILASIPRLKAEDRTGPLRRYHGLAQVDGWAEAVGQLAEPADLQVALSDLTTSFVQVNLANEGPMPVVLLHTVTAPAALRLMLPHLPPQLHLPSYIAMWRANAALLALWAVPRPEEVAVGPDEEQPTLTTSELVGRAVEHGDEHALKLTEACLREYAIRPDVRYLLLAEYMLTKLPRFYRRRGERSAASSP